LIRWNGEGWELIDRGSRNGTWLDGDPIETGKVHRLEIGASIAFGDRNEEWLLADASAPSVMIVALPTGTTLLGVDGVIGVPSEDEPKATVYRDCDGIWKIDRHDQPIAALRNGEVFELAGSLWRFCQPDGVGPTLTAEASLGRETPTIQFAVSRDEEFVSLSMEYSGTTIELGSRTHNFMLLTLARTRLQDRANGLPESSCGWVYKEILGQMVGMSPPQVDGEVFRIRRHLGQHRLDEAASIVERRPRTTQLRLGLSQIRIAKL
jgi:pSer/pThr/pTyr-binding forkhead associated (FHA) protein